MTRLDELIRNIQPPRELCRRCEEWCSMEDIRFDDIPGCPHNYYGSGAHTYIVGEREDCPYFNEW